MLKIYPFKHTEKDVDIMDGKYEGVYSWLTLNYALGTLFVILFFILDQNGFTIFLILRTKR